MEFGFSLVYCKKSDSGGIFNRGKYYPVCGNNNGIQVIGTNRDGDAVVALLHNYGRGVLLNAVDIDGACGFFRTDAEFIDMGDSSTDIWD